MTRSQAASSAVSPLCMKITIRLTACFALAWLMFASSASAGTGPWNLKALQQTPAATWGARTGLVQSVFYEGEPFQGQPTRVFAYVGRPAEGSGPFPAMVLVHGGGGKAFAKWAEHWAQRGYVALAMDTAGCGPDGRLPDGRPDQSDPTKFREFTKVEARDMWTYHAVAAVIRGHSLLASLPEVDRSRIGITGISWGGYLTCIVAGLDDRLKVAVPVYGCGFLGENSCWKPTSLAAMSPAARALWLKLFDPSQYVGDTRCRILFLNGSNDFAYPLDSYRKTVRLVRSKLRRVSIGIKLPHGHIWTFKEVDTFVDSVLRDAPSLARLLPPVIRGGSVLSKTEFTVPLTNAFLHYTTNTGAWQQREWKTEPAQLQDKVVTAALPKERPLTCYLSVIDERGVRVSTQHEELPASRR